jgi:hypothetical protein
MVRAFIKREAGIAELLAALFKVVSQRVLREAMRVGPGDAQGWFLSVRRKDERNCIRTFSPNAERRRMPALEEVGEPIV